MKLYFSGKVLYLILVMYIGVLSLLEGGKVPSEFLQITMYWCRAGLGTSVC
jgi:hypothetical protein